MQNRKK